MSQKSELGDATERNQDILADENIDETAPSLSWVGGAEQTSHIRPTSSTSWVGDKPPE